MSTTKPIIVWLRHDLRLLDNPALYHACQKSDQIVPVYILDDDAAADWKMGAASRWWLHHSLNAFKKDLQEKLGLNLILKRGKAGAILDKIIQETAAETVFWNRNYEPWSIERDKNIKSDLKNQDIDVETYNGRLIFEPWDIETQSGDPYKVFTPFWKNCMDDPKLRDPYPVPDQENLKTPSLESDALDDWDLLPTAPDWSGGIADFWEVGENAAQARFDYFLDNTVEVYKDKRDIPSLDATSRLSPHLHFGEISPLYVYHKTKPLLDEAHGNSDTYKNIKHFISEIGWREFSYHLLYHFPHTPDEPLYDKFKKVPWDKNEHAIQAWQKGQTGIPIVDAGMRQLWQTGWMHNRVRMLVGSLLVKNMLMDWRVGEKWFWDCLVDADLANNTQGWQWVAGCGADAAPYFRIFNPVTQGERFDGHGDYVRQYVPELKDLPEKYIHKPWEADEKTLKDAGIELGKDYPKPIVDLKQSREKALDAFGEMKKD